MTHNGMDLLELFHGFGSNQIFIVAGVAVVALGVIYWKFGRDSGNRYSEGFFEKFEHKAVKIAATVGVAAVVIAAAYMMGMI